MQLLPEQFTLGSTPARRALLAIGVSSPFFVLMLVAHGWALATPEVRAGLEPAVLTWLQGVAVVALASHFATGAYLWPRRERPDAVPRAILLVCLAIGLAFTSLAIASGIFNSGMGPVLLGVVAVGLLLFDLPPMLTGWLLSTLALLAHEVGVQAGWWAYAPAMREGAFVHGEPAWWLAWWRQFVFIAGFAVLIVLLLLAFASLDRVIGKLSRLSNTDRLTGLANRRRFMEVLKTEVARQNRTGQPLCLVLTDADHFKRVNDTHGHLAGDGVLRAIGALMMGCVRSPVDLACRFGGEEFALILPDTTGEQAMAVCTRLREQLAAQRFPEAGAGLRVTLSMGVVESRGLGVEALLRQADEQLYRAKQGGRDRICAGGFTQGGPA